MKIVHLNNNYHVGVSMIAKITVLTTKSFFLYMFKKDNYNFFFIIFFFFCRHYSISDIPWYQRKAASVLFATPPESSFEESLKLFLHAENIDPNFYRWVLTFVFSRFFGIYASPTSGEAYRDRRLTTNFEF